jgi:beta-fructofuranosidase
MSLQLDIEVSFGVPNMSGAALQPPELLADSGQLACAQRSSEGNTGMGPFGVYVLATDDFQELTAIYFHVLQSPGEGLKILVCSDQSRSSVAPNLDTAAFGSFVRVYETDQFLTLKILVRILSFLSASCSFTINQCRMDGKRLMN